MSTIPGLRYQPHSGGNKPSSIFKHNPNRPKSPRQLYLPKTSDNAQYNQGQRDMKGQVFRRSDILYEAQTATLDIKDEDEKDEGIKHFKEADCSRDTQESQRDLPDVAEMPRIVTTVGLWTEEQKLLCKQPLDERGNQVRVQVKNIASDTPKSKSSSSIYPGSLSLSSVAPNSGLTRNGDEPVYATVVKDRLESKFSIPDNEEECERKPGISKTSIKLTDKDTILTGSCIRTENTDTKEEKKIRRQRF